MGWNRQPTRRLDAPVQSTQVRPSPALVRRSSRKGQPPAAPLMRNNNHDDQNPPRADRPGGPQNGGISEQDENEVGGSGNHGRGSYDDDDGGYSSSGSRSGDSSGRSQEEFFIPPPSMKPSRVRSLFNAPRKPRPPAEDYFKLEVSKPMKAPTPVVVPRLFPESDTADSSLNESQAEIGAPFPRYHLSYQCRTKR